MQAAILSLMLLAAAPGEADGQGVVRAARPVPIESRAGEPLPMRLPAVAGVAPEAAPRGGVHSETYHLAPESPARSADDARTIDGAAKADHVRSADRVPRTENADNAEPRPFGLGVLDRIFRPVGYSRRGRVDRSAGRDAEGGSVAIVRRHADDAATSQETKNAATSRESKDVAARNRIRDRELSSAQWQDDQPPQNAAERYPAGFAARSGVPSSAGMPAGEVVEETVDESYVESFGGGGYSYCRPIHYVPRDCPNPPRPVWRCADKMFHCDHPPHGILGFWSGNPAQTPWMMRYTYPLAIHYYKPGDWRNDFDYPWHERCPNSHRRVYVAVPANVPYVIEAEPEVKSPAAEEVAPPRKLEGSLRRAPARQMSRPASSRQIVEPMPAPPALFSPHDDR